MRLGFGREVAGAHDWWLAAGGRHQKGKIARARYQSRASATWAPRCFVLCYDSYLEINTYRLC